LPITRCRSSYGANIRKPFSLWRCACFPAVPAANEETDRQSNIEMIEDLSFLIQYSAGLIDRILS